MVLCYKAAILLDDLPGNDGGNQSFGLFAVGRSLKNYRRRPDNAGVGQFKSYEIDAAMGLAGGMALLSGAYVLRPEERIGARLSGSATETVLLAVPDEVSGPWRYAVVGQPRHASVHCAAVVSG